jgi:hypothetical protein
MTTDGTTLQGGCQCGAVRYECREPPLRTYVCHCTECRKQSSSAFGISVQVPRAAFRVVRGSPKLWSRSTGSGHVLDCWFCPQCGTRLWHQRHGSTETLNIKGGSLDSPVDLHGAVHIWTGSALPGVAIPADAVQFPREPS